jgi:hypothetical protein
MAVLILSKETTDKIRTRAGIDEQRIKEAVKALRDWLEKQPHLPHDYGNYIQISLTFTAVTMKNVVFWDVALCFGGTLVDARSTQRHIPETIFFIALVYLLSSWFQHVILSLNEMTKAE